MDPQPADDALKNKQLRPGSQVLECSDAGHHLYLGKVHHFTHSHPLNKETDNPSEFNSLIVKALD